MWNAVPYRQYPCSASAAFPQGRILRRPILRVTLLANGRRVDCFADVDSGADQCVFPISFAHQLGLDETSNPRFAFTGGVGNAQVPTHYWNIKIQILFGLPPSATLFELDVDAGFTPGLEQQGMGLLGQSGFFDCAKVCFDYQNALFYVETPDPVVTPPPHPILPTPKP